MIIPDCTYCGKQVVMDFDFLEDKINHDWRIEPVEVCTGCGVGQRVLQQIRPHDVPRLRQEVREAWALRQAQRREAAS